MLAVRTADPMTTEMLRREASVILESWDASNRSIEVCISTGAMGLQRDKQTGEIYEETLSTEPGAVDTTRLDAGACPVLADHGEMVTDILGGMRRIPTMRTTIGRCLEGTLRYEPGKVFLRHTLTAADDAKPEVQRIEEGTVRTTSPGYLPLEWIESEGTSGRQHRHVTRYMLCETSYTPFPMDPGAQARSEEESMRLRNTVRHAPEGAAAGGAPVVATEPTPEQIRAIELATEKRVMTRTNDIRSLCTRHGIDIDAAPVQGEPEAMTKIRAAMTIEGVSTSVDTVRAAVLDVLATRTDAHGIRSGHRIDMGRDETQTSIRAIDAELQIRCGLTVDKADAEIAVQHRTETLLDLGRRCLELNGVNTRQFQSRGALARAILHQAPSNIQVRAGSHQTGDFPNMTATTVTSVLRGERDVTANYEWFKKVMSRIDLPDYEDRKVVDAGGLGELPVVLEGAEYNRVTFGEDAVVWHLVKHGFELALTEEMLLANKIQEFLRRTRTFARSCKRTESSIAAVSIFANPTMGDSQPLFDAAAWAWDKKKKVNSGGHANLSTSGGAPTVVRINEMDLMLRKQVDRDGSAVGSRAVFWIGPDDYATGLEQIYSEHYKPVALADAVTVPLATENRLYVPSRAGTKPWVMATADSMGAEYGYLEGEGGPIVLEYSETRSDARIFHLRDVFAAKVNDPRPFAMNPGQ